MIRNKEAETVRLTPNEFAALREYSCTIPTGVYDWKAWKRREPYRDADGPPFTWWMGEYEPIHGTDKCRINWYRIVIREPITDYSIRGDYPAYVH